MNPFKLILNNQRTDKEGTYVLLTANSYQNLSGITTGTSVNINSIPNQTITADLVDSGRLYFVKGQPTNIPPTPDGKDYFGWVEFSKKATDCDANDNCQLWINLSNVDMYGMQLAISGVDIMGNPFSVGYKSGATDSINYLSKKFPGAVVKTNGLNKILAPNIVPSAYATFDNYVSSLVKSNAKMTIVSDYNSGSSPQSFSGSFCSYFDFKICSRVYLKLTDTSGNTFKITKKDLSSTIIYKCDTGSIYYNNIKYPQNRSGKTENEIVTNSVFRKIMLGLNEGYFSMSGSVNSCDFPSYTPFKNGGNKYAEEIHNLSNSYGFPYADSNLKVLITAKASISTPITITICDDTTATGFTDTKSTDNSPVCGNFEFGIGINSVLGKIQIGDTCTYTSQSQNTYGGFVPTCNDWTKMYFSGLTNYIWIKTSTLDVQAIDDNGNNCLIYKGAAPFWTKAADGHMSLQFGNTASWNPSASSPSKPTR